MMRYRVKGIAAFLMIAAAGSGALAYNLSGQRWLSPRAVFHIGIPGQAPSGVPWSRALRDAMAAWTRETAFEFVAEPDYLDPCAGFEGSESGQGFPVGEGDSRNGAGFRADVCGNRFGTGVLAITLSLSNQGNLGFPQLDQTDIIFNSAYDWDIYTGPVQGRIDFGRVALHELGHALGLDHSNVPTSIMAPNYGALHTLQLDDIDGANAIYDVHNCAVRDLTISSTVVDGLNAGDCRVSDLFGGSSDTSFVDVYRVTVTRTTDIDIVLHSSELDPVLILANAKLGGLEIHDDTDGSCDARIRRRVPPGEYRILVNTYEEPQKCAGNTGSYALTVSDAGEPLLNPLRNATRGPARARAVITGGATADDGESFPGRFAANQPFDIYGRVIPDPAHVGRFGRVYVLVTLGDGRQFIQRSDGQFVRFTGSLDQLEPRMTGLLRAEHYVPIVPGFQGAAMGLSGQSFAIHLGYALASNPAEIWYGSEPIRFSIDP